MIVDWWFYFLLSRLPCACMRSRVMHLVMSVCVCIMYVYVAKKNWLFGVLLLKNPVCVIYCSLVKFNHQKRAHYARWFVQRKNTAAFYCITVGNSCACDLPVHCTIPVHYTAAPSWCAHAGYMFCGTLLKKAHKQENGSLADNVRRQGVCSGTVQHTYILHNHPYISSSENNVGMVE